MRIARTIAATAAAAALVAGSAATATADTEPANTSLAAVLTADGDDFDNNTQDFDIVTQAVLAVLAAKPDSPVSLLTDGDVALTAFVPKDNAFHMLVHDVTGEWLFNEEDVFNTIVAAYGVDAIEDILLYHVVPGATIDAATARTSDGANLTTALGTDITVDAKCFFIRLVDADTDDRNPVVFAGDINAGNPQIAHGITRVLRPSNLDG